MVETRERQSYVRCEECKEAIQPDQPCYQLRYGYMNEEGFSAEEDVAYFCKDCSPK